MNNDLEADYLIDKLAGRLERSFKKVKNKDIDWERDANGDFILYRLVSEGPRDPITSFPLADWTWVSTGYETLEEYQARKQQ